ncbi:hypothetical protein GKE82_24815 [Conexibacter sp. W3-3-2]|uniref:hypothetical protein n=1 Tax=Conexibacter sp. W3-3-2 TaxID=2675227 RepID=UPI0012B888E7|nr:hypothetical protein [Conexibacter sp. W3-3-2]MTD47429.1 hypothetical protein [Conexibacter sp. W3-3-2]
MLLRIGLLTLIGALLSGPLDNAWHEAFGRDSVLWSPPHMLGIVGSLGLAYIMLLHLSTTPQHHRVLGAATAGLVVAAAAFSVAEYETDVPQFAPVWYPIVLAFAATVALRLITNTTTARWAATNAAAVQSVFVAVTGALLLGLGYDAPWFSLMLAPGLAIDLGVRRRWGYARCAGAITLAVVLVVMPLREIAGGVGLTASDIGPAAAGVYVTSLLALWLADGAPRRRGGLLTAATALALLLPGAAYAHDPGQGNPAGTVAWRAQTTRQDVTATVRADALCGRTPARLVARRGGRLIRGSDLRGDCRRTGRLNLDRAGRWFLYLEIDAPDGRIESWVPVTAGTSRTSAQPLRYAYYPRTPGRASTIKLGAGLLLYSLVAAFLVLLARAARALQPTTSAKPA